MAEDEGTIAVARILAGYYMCAVTAREDEGQGLPGAESVPGTSPDHERWVAARRRYENDYADADAVLDAPVAWPWWAGPRRLARMWWVPGYWVERRARAAQGAERTALLDQAEQRYRPVHEEILARATAVREERERAQRVAQERRGRLATVAQREVWGWAWDGGSSDGVVFRYDVEEARSQPASAGARARGPFSLYRVGDELYEYGMSAVRWSDVTKLAVVADCAKAGHPLTFTEWWDAVGPWERPHQAPTEWCTNRPLWPVPTDRSRRRLREDLARGSGGSHSSYGIGDSGFGGHF